MHNLIYEIQLFIYSHIKIGLELSNPIRDVLFVFFVHCATVQSFFSKSIFIFVAQFFQKFFKIFLYFIKNFHLITTFLVSMSTFLHLYYTSIEFHFQIPQKFDVIGSLNYTISS